MRAPPPVSIDIPAPRGWRAVQALAFAAAGACVAAWSAQHVGWPDAQVAGAAALGALGLAALGWHLCRGTPMGLAWTGRQWLYRSPAAAEPVPVDPVISLDLGGWMLLRLKPPLGAVVWVAVSRGDAGAAWHLLRAALYAEPPAAHPEGEAAP